jgi:hypothetical protein
LLTVCLSLPLFGGPILYHDLYFIIYRSPINSYAQCVHTNIAQ